VLVVLMFLVGGATFPTRTAPGHCRTCGRLRA
jgi:hypothetical protein